MIGKIILEFDEVESTNLTANELIKKNEILEGTIILSKFQKHGKGQEGNYWESEAEKNLLMSVVLCPTFLKPEKQFILNKIVSLAVAEFVEKMLPRENVKIKWPNDIYVDDKKVAGILINNIIKGNSFEYTIIGIGININQKVYLSNAPNPVSIAQLSDENYDIKKVLIIFNEILNRWYELLRNGLFSSIDKNYLNSLYRIETYYSYKISDNTIKAKITGISEYGHLKLIGDDNQLYECDLKEIKFVI